MIRHTRIQICDAKSALGYFDVNESQATVKTNERWLLSGEMHFMRRSAGYTCSDCKQNEVFMTQYKFHRYNRIYRTVQKKLKRTLQQDSKISAKWKMLFGMTSEAVEGFCFIIPVTGSSRAVLERGMMIMIVMVINLKMYM
jgi:hypothetical protein